MNATLPADRRYWFRLKMRVAQRTGDYQDSEDLLHSAVVRYLASSIGYDETEPAGVLLRTVRNLKIDDWRRQTRDFPNRLKYRFRCDAQITADPLQTLVDRTTLTRAMRAIDELAPRRRAVFLMRHLDELPVKDIAAHHGVSVSLVEKELIAARAFLHDWLQAEHLRDDPAVAEAGDRCPP